MQGEWTNDCLSEGLFAGKGDAGNALQIVKNGPAMPRGEQADDGFALPVTDFQGEETSGF